MASCSYLNPDNTFNRSAILKAAWSAARIAVVRNDTSRGAKWWAPLSLRAAFADALRRIWDLARGHRACIAHFATAQAKDAHRSALPAREREILNLRDARALAPMIDSTPRMLAEVAAIDARAAALGIRL